MSLDKYVLIIKNNNVMDLIVDIFLRLDDRYFDNGVLLPNCNIKSMQHVRNKDVDGSDLKMLLE